jgi:lysophospholipase L1-like esterase
MTSNRQLFEYHPVVGYRFVPGLRARIPHESGGYLVRVNESGFRCDHSFNPRRTPGKRRVLLFGDSFTAGDGVSNGKRYGDLLEQLVPDLEVYNFGLPGTGTDQHFLAYREFAGEIEHDLLIIAVLVENIRRVTARYRYYQNDEGVRVCYAKPHFRLEGGQLRAGHIPAPREPVDEATLPPSERGAVDRVVRYPRLTKLLARTGTTRLVFRLLRYNPYPEYRRAATPGWQLMRALLLEWISGHPRPVLLLPVPLYYFLEGYASARSYQARFRELARDAHCRLHDPLPDLLGYPAAERRGFRFESDIHLSPAGHVALARSLAPVVADVLVSSGSPT